MRGYRRVRRAARAGLLAVGLVASVAAHSAPTDDTILTVALKHCDECHTPGGRQRKEWMPLVYGQPRIYVRRMLAQFKAGTRPGPEMSRELSTYTAAELDLLADLVSRRAPVTLEQDTDPYLAAFGKAIYEERCYYCHPDEGRGSEFDSAILAGQPLAYLRRQFDSILTGQRPVLYMMREAYAGLHEDEFEALSHFFASRAPSRPEAWAEAGRKR